MALIVENGSIIADANSYVSAADADAYFLAIGNSAWGNASSELREGALRRVTRYIDSFSYSGSIESVDQKLKWPRFNAYDDEGRLIEGIPELLKEAVLELALHMIVEGSIDGAIQENGKVIREKVGPIDTTYSNSTGKVRFPFLQRLLLPIGANISGNMIRLVRS